MKISQFIVRQKYRFDIGASFLTVINFALLLVVAAEKLQGLLGISKARYFVILGAAGGLFGVWLLGFLLDRYLRVIQLYNREANERNEDLQLIKGKLTSA